MRNFFCFILAIILILCVLFPFCPKASAKETQRYGYSLLHNSNQQRTYQALVDGVNNLQKEIKITISGVNGDTVKSILQELKFACQMVCRDYPELFWYDGGAAIDILNNEVTLTIKDYKVNGKSISSLNELAGYKKQLDDAVSRAFANIRSNFSDYEIAHEFHDYLINQISYAYEGDHQTVYGALVNGVAVCAGYTRAYQLLMNLAGLPCWYISGRSYTADGRLFGHSWNLVWLDGMCYYTDVTWDDQMNELFHEYLNLSKEEISKTHFTEDILPADCGHDGYTFFVRNDGRGVCDYHGHKTSQEIAGCFELKSLDGDVATYYCTIHYHADDFRVWFDQHKEEIISTLELTGSVRVRVIEMGLEHHVTLTGIAKTEFPTQAPTQPPIEPTVPPTQEPTQAPTTAPTVAPTQPQTEMPATEPFNQPQQSTIVPTEVTETVPETIIETQAPTPVQTQPVTEPYETIPIPTVSTTQPNTQTEEMDNSKNDSLMIGIIACSVGALGVGAFGLLCFLRGRKL